MTAPDIPADAAQAAPVLGEGMALIQVERRRQIEAEGYDTAHDAEHGPDPLYRAATCYASAGLEWHGMQPPNEWPWEAAAWKPKGIVQNLIRAGALYLAAAEVAPGRERPKPGQGGVVSHWLDPERLRESAERAAREIDLLLDSAILAARLGQQDDQQAADRAAVEAVEALADEWQRELDERRITTECARYCWGVAVHDVRSALAAGRQSVAAREPRSESS